MMESALLAWAHYVGFTVLFSAMVAQHLLFDDLAPAALARRLTVLHYILLGSLVLVLLTGLAKVGGAAGGASYYMKNGVFHAKLSVFALVALVSVWPTIHFLRGQRLMRQGAAQVTYPRKIRVALRVQMVGLLLILLLAAMLARGIGG